MKNLLNLKKANFFLEEKSKTPECHLPKINKANNPGRPDINSINCTSKISEFVDYYLRPEVKKL